MLRRELLTTCFCAAALASTAAAAYADSIVGNPGQSNNVSNTNSQVGVQGQGGGVVVGDQTQLATNSSTGVSPSGQTIGAGAGSTLAGNASQANKQGNLLIQSQNQNSNGGTNSGTTFQGAVNTGSYAGGNAQSIETGGGTIIGNPIQTNDQYDGASQGTVQDPTIVDADLIACLGSGNVCQSAQNDYSGPLANLQTIGAPATVLVGNPAQSNGQTTVVPQYIGQAFVASPDTSPIIQNQLQLNGTSQTSTELIF